LSQKGRTPFKLPNIGGSALSGLNRM